MFLSAVFQSGAITVHEMFDVTVINSLWTMLTGSRFSLSDSRLRKLLSLLRESFRLQDMSGGLLNQMPFLRFLAPKLSGYNKTIFIMQSLNKFLEVIAHFHIFLNKRIPLGFKKCLLACHQYYNLCVPNTTH